MIQAMEEILLADESARKWVAEARAEAERILSTQESELKNLLETGQRELDEAVHSDRERILSDARLRVARIAEETDRYIAELGAKKILIEPILIQRLLEKVIGL